MGWAKSRVVPRRCDARSALRAIIRVKQAACLLSSRYRGVSGLIADMLRPPFPDRTLAQERHHRPVSLRKNRRPVPHRGHDPPRRSTPLRRATTRFGELERGLTLSFRARRQAVRGRTIARAGKTQRFRRLGPRCIRIREPRVRSPSRSHTARNSLCAPASPVSSADVKFNRCARRRMRSTQQGTQLSPASLALTNHRGHGSILRPSTL